MNDSMKALQKISPIRKTLSYCETKSYMINIATLKKIRRSEFYQFGENHGYMLVINIDYWSLLTSNYL